MSRKKSNYTDITHLRRGRHPQRNARVSLLEVDRFEPTICARWWRGAAINRRLFHSNGHPETERNSVYHIGMSTSQMDSILHVQELRAELGTRGNI